MKKNNAFKIILILVTTLTLIKPISADLLALEANIFDTTGEPLTGDLVVEIWDSVSGGNVVYNSTNDFNNNITSGKIDVMLGSGTIPLNLTYGVNYFMDIYVNNEDIDFNGNERQEFQSPVGNITNNTLGFNIFQGIGTTNSIPKFSDTSSLTDSSLTDNTTDITVSANFIPNNNVRNLGAISNFWSNLFVDVLTANSISSNSINISGTNSSTFTIHSNNPTDDTDNLELIFELGNPIVNALLKWDAVIKQFDFNKNVFIQQNLTVIGNITGTNVTTTDSLFTDFVYPDSSGKVSFQELTHFNSNVSFADNLTVAGSTLYVDASNNKVGINSTSPQTLLEVDGDVNISNQNTLFIGGGNITWNGSNLIISG
jgi:hypothetical protein